MADLSHNIGSDLALGSTGDLATVSGDAETQQRVLRRLITNPRAYIWQLPYGGGLAAFIGQPVNDADIAAVVRAQMALEATVAAMPEPTVTVTPSADGDGTNTANVSYVDATTGATQTLACPLGA